APGKTLASPAVRSYARERGVDLATVVGTGKDGRITRADVDAAVARPAAPTAGPVAMPAVQPPPFAGVATRQDEQIRIIGLRRKIAEKMVESYSRKPHFTYVDEVDATALVALRAELKEVAEARGVKLTYLPFIMKALCLVFREFPTVNSVLDEDTMTMTVRGEVNLGIATDTPQGLYVPVVKNCEQKSILELAAEVADLTARTRAGQVRLDELQGGTFTITSVGNIGGRFATPIINAPECAILGVNQIHDRPMVIDGQVVPRKMMYLSPSFDHRVLDGAVAARFTQALKTVLETPSRLLLELR
ncbi:MAG: 2-oxo acid dehydrogenase subunit E2, partial [Deltaproteobacteria bacterium]